MPVVELGKVWANSRSWLKVRAGPCEKESMRTVLGPTIRRQFGSWEQERVKSLR